MHRLTIRARITIWYTFSMVLLTALVLILLVHISDRTYLNSREEELSEAVNDAADDLLDGDGFDFFNDGVYLALWPGEDSFPSDEKLLAGRLPAAFPQALSFEESGVRVIESTSPANNMDAEAAQMAVLDSADSSGSTDPASNTDSGNTSSGTSIPGGTSSGAASTVQLNPQTQQTSAIRSRGYLVLDRLLLFSDGSNLWLRGVTEQTLSPLTGAGFFGAVFVLLPLFVLLCILTGYLITRRALLPVRRIQETAQKITETNALSTRIGLPAGRDEISRLAGTIDEMLNRLEQSFAHEKQFTSDASHELRTPLSVILNESEYILQHGDSLEEARESMEVVNRQANRMSELINQLLFFARADRGSIQLELEPTAFSPMVQEFLEEFRSQTEAAGISLQFCDELGADAVCRIDRLQFCRALQNLLQNAVSYGRAGGYIHVRTYRDGKNAAVSITDNGIGISKEALPHIWDRFYQADPSRSRQSGSMGLGLSMVRWIAEQHGGSVSVSSTPGQGSTFVLKLRLEKNG